MKNFFCSVALTAVLIGLSASYCLAGRGDGAAFRPAPATHRIAGLYAVAQTFYTESDKQVADISIASNNGIQLVTVTAATGLCRAVLSDEHGQILRSRAVEDEIDLDFWSMPTGTYHLSILDASGALQIRQTLVKR